MTFSPYLAHTDPIFVKFKYTTRSRDLLRVPQGTIHFVSVSARLWNVLVLKIDVRITLSKFKYNLKIFLLHNEIELKYSKLPKLFHS